MKKRTLRGAIIGALLDSVPFVLITAAVILFALWGVSYFIEGNVLYKLATMTPEPGEGGDLLVLDEKKKEELVENNEGDAFTVVPEFPAIALGEKWATITIESAEVWQVPVYHGDNSDILWNGIGHYSNSRFPGQNGKVVLAGHVGIYEHFQRLETMSEGDEVVLDTIYGKYVYRVTDTAIFDEHDPTLLLPEETDSGDRLICYTCYPFNTTSVRTQRFAIICELVEGEDWTKPRPVESDAAVGEVTE